MTTVDERLAELVPTFADAVHELNYEIAYRLWHRIDGLLALRCAVGGGQTISLPNKEKTK